MNENNELEFIEILETIRHKFKPRNYRFILAESLCSFFYSYTTSPTEIKNHTNKILSARNLKGISLGFVRNIIED